MKETAEIGTVELSDSSIQLGDLTDLKVPLKENVARFLGGTTIINRGRRRDVIDPYRICKDLQASEFETYFSK